MGVKKACVIYVPKLKAVAAQLGGMLETEGFEVCLTEATEPDARAAQSGVSSLAAAIKNCMVDANVCYFLIGAPVPADVLSQATGVLGKEPRIVVVAEDVTVVPREFDDFADALIKVGSEALEEVVKGRDCWEGSDGAAAPRRTPKRVKCQ